MLEQLPLLILSLMRGFIPSPFFQNFQNSMDESIGTRIRQNSFENQHGKKLLSLCQSHNWRIMVENRVIH
jgi:hypothetical protein